MDYYDIVSLIVFWIHQEKDDFAVLRKIVGVMRDQSIAEEDKGDIIFAILRESGLYEVDFEDFLEASSIHGSIEEPDDHSELIFVDLINARISIIIHLN